VGPFTWGRTAGESGCEGPHAVGSGRMDRTGGRPAFPLWVSARLFWLSGCACPVQQLVAEVDNLGNPKSLATTSRILTPMAQRRRSELSRNIAIF
jgi:hypothetical protein